MHAGGGDQDAHKIKPRRQAKDPALFTSLVRAHKAHLIVISVNSSRLNHPDSPIWEASENVAPLLAMLMLSIILILAGELIVGVAFLLLGVISYIALIRPWILQRVSRRAVNAAVTNLYNWELLWKKGGLVITQIGRPSARCASPKGDWRAFVSKNLPVVEMEPSQLQAAFTKIKNETAIAPSLDQA